jgi:hypothetical protein
MHIMSAEETLRMKLEALMAEHRRLDLEVADLATRAAGALQLELQRLKRRKLALKDEITVLRDRLEPDIIA